MDVSSTDQHAADSDADTLAIGVFDGEQPPAGSPAALAELLASGEARRSFKALALAHADARRWLLVGLGPRADFTAERARVIAAAVGARAREISTRALCWEIPAEGDGAIAAAIVQGTILGDYSFERFKSAPTDGDAAGGQPPKHLERLLLAGADGLEGAVYSATLVAEAANRARDLQNRPANDLTPTALAEYATAMGAELDGLSVEVEGLESIRARGMGAFAAVAQGSEQEPALITMRYDGSASGPTLGFVGKAVTFDSGGISLKPGAKMAEMKFDMSGGAAVVEAVSAIARLKLASEADRGRGRDREPAERAGGQAGGHRDGRER